MNNSFDIEQNDGVYTLRSKNWPECVATGDTLDEAVDRLNRKIIYLKDNDPVRFKRVVSENIRMAKLAGKKVIGVFMPEEKE